MAPQSVLELLSRCAICLRRPCRAFTARLHGKTESIYLDGFFGSIAIGSIRVTAG